jgi:hypothetical protein
MNQIQTNKTTNVRNSFLFTAILSNLDLNIPNNSSTLVEYSLAIFILGLIALLCFISVLLYLSVYFIIQKKDYEKKYPKFKFFINYYKNITLFFVIIEALICLTSLTIITVSSLLFFFKFKS